MKKAILFVIAAISFAETLSAQQTPYDFLRIDVNARAAALNGSFVSMKDDPNVLFYNPASLGTLSSPKISASYVDYLMDANLGSLSYCQNIKGVGDIGVGVTYINYGSFTRTDENLNELGTFEAKELAFIAGIAGHYDNEILFGANIKYIYSSIAEYTSTALAVDIGFLYDIPSQNLSIGASVLNLGTQLKKYMGTTELLPLDIKFGITKRPEHLPINLNLDFHRLNENGNTFWDRFSAFTFGAEILMSDNLRLRAGYNNKNRKDLKMSTGAGLAGFSFGAGLLIKNYQFDYSYNTYGKDISMHHISLGASL